MTTGIDLMAFKLQLTMDNWISPKKIPGNVQQLINKWNP